MSQRSGPRAAKIASKLPAPVQITAEQLLREAKERQEAEPKRPRQKISDVGELSEYRGRKRREFEDAVRRNRNNMGCWMRYAFWEEAQGELERARSIYERALDIDHRSVPLWLKYAEMEMKTRNINHARNVWDRAVSLMPRVDQFWYKYTYMEEALGNVVGARQIFERWMDWQPDEQAWLSFIKFERRYDEYDRVRNIFERMVAVHPGPKTWLKYAKMEEELSYRGASSQQQQQQLGDSSISSTKDAVRRIFERAVETLGERFMDEKLYMEFAAFEIRCKDFERARTIFKYALSRLNKTQAEAIYNMYTQFEKQHGNRKGIEDVIISKRRFQYEEEIKANSRNYDAWFDYARLEENDCSEDILGSMINSNDNAFNNNNNNASKANSVAISRVREIYERAIAQVPLVAEKRFWRRYIYLWINYALFEELVAGDQQRTRDVYKACLQVIPHQQFTFAKIWLLYAKFEIRCLELTAARKALGMALGTCPKDKLFKGYIELELQLREFDRCRKLYEKYLEHNPSNCAAWIKYAELERLLGDYDRARAIFELAVAQPLLDMPELLWKAYIDFEFSLEEFDLTRALYERLLERTEHVKVWVSFANFEATLPIIDDTDSQTDTNAAGQHDQDQDQAQDKSNAVSAAATGNALALAAALRQRIERARGVYERGYEALRRREEPNAKEERVILLEAWREFEKINGTAADLQKVNAKMPRKIKKRREIIDESGKATGWEEYFDYVFPDDKTETPMLKFLAMANMWKSKKGSDDEDDNDGGDENDDNDDEKDNDDDDGERYDRPSDSRHERDDDDDDEK